MSGSLLNPHGLLHNMQLDWKENFCFEKFRNTALDGRDFFGYFTET